MQKTYLKNRANYFASENHCIFTPQSTLTISGAKNKVSIHSTGYHFPEPLFFPSVKMIYWQKLKDFSVVQELSVFIIRCINKRIIPANTTTRMDSEDRLNEAKRTQKDQCWCHDPTYVRYLQWPNSRNQRLEWWLPGVGGQGEMCAY